VVLACFLLGEVLACGLLNVVGDDVISGVSEASRFILLKNGRPFRWLGYELEFSLRLTGIGRNLEGSDSE